MFGAVSSWLQAGEEAANALAEKAGFAIEQKDKGANSNEDDARRAASVPMGPVWEAPVTPAWQDTSVEWRTLLLGVLRDENTYLIAPKRLLEDDHVGERLRSVPGIDLNGAVSFDFETDTKPWIECLSELDGLEALRYQLVPALVSDENFWHNAVWRVKVLRSMAGVAPAMNFLRIVNTEPTEAPCDPAAGRMRNIGRRDQGKHLGELEASVLAFREAAEWSATKVETLRAELSSCRSNLQLLRNLMSANDVDQIDLAQSVRESVEFHKAKLGGHLAELDNADAVALEASPQLVPSEGELYIEAIDLNADVQATLRKFASWHEDMIQAQRQRNEREASEAPCGGGPLHSSVPRAAADGVSVTSVEESDTAVTVSSGPRDSVVGGAPADTATAFNATVPWDDDDDDDDDA